MSDDDRKVVDEEDREALQTIADMRGLPLQYRSGGQTVAESSLIAKPDAHQLQAFQNLRVRTCGSCKFFRREAFQEVAPEFMKKLVREYEWNPAFLEHPTKMGRCAQDEELVVGPNSLGCDQYRPQ